MSPKPDPDNIEREPPNWYVLPIMASILIILVVTYRFACSSP